MLTRNTITNHRWKSSVIYLLVVASFVSVFASITSTSQPVSAITNAQKQHCISTYPAGTTIATRAPGSGSPTDTTNGDWNKNSCGDVCTTMVTIVQTPAGSVQNTVVKACDGTGGGCPGCGPVGSPPATTTVGGAIYNTYNQVVLDKYCPSSMSNQAGCITKINDVSLQCIPTDATTAAINFDVVAKCLQTNSPGSPKITASVIEPLLKKAQSAAQQNADSAAAALKCNSDPSATWNPTANGGKGACDSNSGNGQSTCQVDGIGWIICPVMNFMAKVVNAVYSVVSDMLTTPAINTNTNDSNNALYQTWSSFRNIANIAFVVAFLIIIYSQITSVGITNYGIKKMLPRIIIAAILVNVSYWICAIAIDLSNIVGSSVVGLFNGITPKTTSTGSNFNGGNGVINWVGGTAAVLAVVGVALYAGLTVLLPIIITAVVAILTVVIVLTARQAIIILLVAVAPLAFVAFLLPNTEKWFKKWRETFVAMLVMFPVIAAVFGASKLASAVIMKTAGGNITLQIMGAGVSIIPLIISPIVMKASTGILGKIGGYVNNPNKGPFDRMRKGAANMRERQENRRGIRALNGGRVVGRGRFTRQAKREAIDTSLKRERANQAQQYVADEATAKDKDGNILKDANGNPIATRFGKQLAGAGPLGGGADAAAIQSALANAQFTIDEATAKEIKAESVMVRDLDAKALKDIFKSDSGASDAKKAAAMQRLIRIGDPGGPDGYENQVNDAINSKSDVLRRATAEALASDGPGWVKASDVDKIASGTIMKQNLSNADARSRGLSAPEDTSIRTIARDNSAAGTLSAEKLVNETNGSIKFAFDASDDDGKTRIIASSSEAQANDQLKGKIKHNVAAIEALTDPTKHIARTPVLTRTVSVPSPGGGSPTIVTKTNSFELNV